MLSPGSTDTPVFGKFGLPAEVAAQIKAGFVESILLQRTGQPRAVGRVAVFLAVEDSSFLLGG